MDVHRGWVTQGGDWQRVLGLMFAGAAIVEAFKAHRSLDANRKRNALVSAIGAGACLTIAEECIRADWV